MSISCIRGLFVTVCYYNYIKEHTQTKKQASKQTNKYDSTQLLWQAIFCSSFGQAGQFIDGHIPGISRLANSHWLISHRPSVMLRHLIWSATIWVIKIEVLPGAATIADQPRSQWCQSREGSVVCDAILHRESSKHCYIPQYLDIAWARAYSGGFNNRGAIADQQRANRRFHRHFLKIEFIWVVRL